MKRIFFGVALWFSVMVAMGSCAYDTMERKAWPVGLTIGDSIFTVIFWPFQIGWDFARPDNCGINPPPPPTAGDTRSAK
jgi:hypothetical protein